MTGTRTDEASQAPAEKAGFLRLDQHVCFALYTASGLMTRIYRPLLEPLGLSFDAMLYHPQIPELIELVDAFPGTRIVLDHIGAPIGIGVYAGKRQEQFGRWAADIRELARRPNVWLKLGGMAQRVNGLELNKRATPPSSECRSDDSSRRSRRRC